ncbi:MAG TPA: ribonucleoside-diphosphate reductase subunit alpha [Candidatus Paceibacterota bacterium]
MAIELVKKRSGSIVEFDRVRIEKAIEKAYNATETEISYEELGAITDSVVMDANERFGNSIPDVESIQDMVEKAIATKGDFEVAKSYILYRGEHAEARFKKQQETLALIDRAELKVKKRSGKIVAFDNSQIEVAVKNVCGEFEECLENVSSITKASKLTLYDGISTSDINKGIIMALKSYIEKDPQFSYIAARFLINDLYKDVIGVDEWSKHFQMIHKSRFSELVKRGVNDKRLDPRLLDFDLDRLASEMDTARDRLFEFMGAQVLYDRYFLKDSNQKFLETPQYFWMRVAMGMAITEKDKDQVAIDFYHTLSRMLYVPSTPTLLHSGTYHPQMSSCFLSTAEDDLHHIFKVVGDNAQLSKWSGGVANDWTDIRATNALVKSINVGSQGVIPFLKIVDSTTASINRSGKRRGATCVYLETWHADIEDFLDLRKNTGDERRRTHDTNTANWIPDLFIKRVIEGGDWTLFSPEEVPELHHIYGKAFEEKYTSYEKMANEGKIRLFKRLKANDLWRKMIMMLFETGHPWLTFKDPANIRSPQDHVGVVHCSNLCTEITLNTSREETAVCNIGSLNLPRHLRGGVINWVLLEKTVKQAMRMLDNVIDLSFYPVKEAENSNKKHRPVGLGIMGLQDVFYEMNLNFDSEQAVGFSDELMEFVSYHAILTSSEIAKEKGTYSSFKGSKWDRDLLPLNTLDLLERERGIPIDIKRDARMDWVKVRTSIKANGMRNSNTMAIAPTATISNISGCTPSIEPIYKNIYVKSNFSGEFTVVNEHLVKDLKQIGLWTAAILEKIKLNDGNLSTISEIPDKLRQKYKEAFEIDSYWVAKHAAYRGKWIDQSQSVNFFMKTESGKQISDTYINAWKMGLKSTYYLRTLGATSIEKTTVDIKAQDILTEVKNAVAEEAKSAPKITVIDGKICESCE